MGGQPGRHQRGDEGGRPGNDGYHQVLGEKLLDQECSGIGDARRSGIGNQGNESPRPDPGSQFRSPFPQIVAVVADERFMDVVETEQLSGMAGILRGNQVHGAQHFERPQGDVGEITQGGGDHKESAGRSCHRPLNRRLRRHWEST